LAPADQYKARVVVVCNIVCDDFWTNGFSSLPLGAVGGDLTFSGDEELARRS